VDSEAAGEAAAAAVRASSSATRSAMLRRFGLKTKDAKSYEMKNTTIMFLMPFVGDL
jgi:hypothetical protein